MIKSLTITNHKGDSIKLELAKPEKSGFIVKSIDGLGPVKANINTSTAGASDGAFFNSARLDSRSIVMSLKFLPIGNESVEDVRLRSYKYFPIKKKIQFLVETDNRVLQTTGYVEANEPNIFSRNEGCSITINCPDPFFYSPTLSETSFAGVRSVFEFPFSNESLNDSLIIFGSINDSGLEFIHYNGDAEIGMVIEIHAVGDVENISLINADTGEKMHLDTSKVDVYDGIYPEWISGEEYKKKDVVIYKNIGYVCLHDCSETDDPLNSEYDTGYNNKPYWIDFKSLEYPKFSYNTRYSYGEGCSYIGDGSERKFICINPLSSKYESTYPSGLPFNGGSMWLEVTDLFNSPFKMIAGDTITVDTRKGSKSVTLLRNGLYYNILNTLDRNSKWLTLSSGDNIFSYDAEYGMENLQFKIYNDVVYDGV